MKGVSGWANNKKAQVGERERLAATYPRRQVREPLNFLNDILLVGIGDGANDIELDLLFFGPLVPQDEEEQRRHQPSEAHVVVAEHVNKEPFADPPAEDLHVTLKPRAVSMTHIVNHFFGRFRHLLRRFDHCHFMGEH